MPKKKKRVEKVPENMERCPDCKNLFTRGMRRTHDMVCIAKQKTGA